MNAWVILLLLVLGLLLVAWLLALAITHWHIHRWWGIRHMRYFAYTNLIMNSHRTSTIAGVHYQPTEEELQYIDDVREGKA